MEFLFAAQAGRVLTNDDIRRMVQAGSDETSVIEAIQASKPNFDTSVPELLALHNAGVSQKILRAMLSASRRDTETPAPLPNEAGVYVKREGGYVEVEAERVEWGSYSISFSRTMLYAVAADPRSSALRICPAHHTFSGLRSSLCSSTSASAARPISSCHAGCSLPFAGTKRISTCLSRAEAIRRNIAIECPS